MSLNHYLTRLTALCVLPLMLLAIFLAAHHVQGLRASQDRHEADKAHNVANALDQNLNARIGSLQILADSPLVDNPPRLAELYTEAQAYRQQFGGHVILADRSMQTLFNTRAPFEQAAVGMAHVAPDGRWLLVNQKLCDIVGYGREELLTRSFQDITHPDDLEADLGHVRRLLAGATNTYAMEKRYVHKNGRIVWINLTGSLVRDENRAPCYFISVIEDIDGRKQAEVEKQKFFLLAESSSEFIGMCDLGMQPLYVNPAGQGMVGLPDMAAACRIKEQDYFFPEDQKFIAEEFFPRVLRDGHGDVEIRLRHLQTGEPIWMFYYLSSVRDASGTVVGWATVSRNINERKQAEDEIRRLNADLERRVEERTRELETTNEALHAAMEELSGKNAELERLNRIFVGRELRMRELKLQLAELTASPPGEVDGE